MTAWLDALEDSAPDVVAAYRGIEDGRFISVRREVRRRAGEGTAQALAEQLGAIATAMAEVIAEMPEEAFRMPGGEEDWNVAQALSHDAAARAGLMMAGARAAAGRWPADAPTVIPSVPGSPDATRDELLRRLARSQQIVERSAAAIAGHETEPCPLEHPLVGRLRCGEWILFAGVHDLMHLEQLHRLAGTVPSPTLAP